MVTKKTRKSKTKMYFGPEQEQAVLDYIDSGDETLKNNIFNEWLKAPIDKMVESIIRRYGLYRKTETFDISHTDAVSDLMTKIHKFKRGKGKKAYSYFGTIIKNYVLGLLIKDAKHLKKMTSYDIVASSLEESEEFSYHIDTEEFVFDEFFIKLSNSIKEEMKDDDYPVKKKLSENERKLGYSLIDILENWETLFEGMEGGSKYNKNSVLETIRNYTNLSTKDIRLCMKRYKAVYDLLKNHGL